MDGIALRPSDGTDLVEAYFERGWTDGLPVVPPTPAKIAAMVDALGGEPGHVECRVAPRWGLLTREVLAVNMVMAGCLPSYAPVVRAALLALTDPEFNLNGVQATTHMAAPLVVVNGPIARAIGMNGGANAFGPGNRANATIGRAIRLVLLNVGGAHPPDLDKCTLGNPAKYSYAVCENEAESPFAPYHVEKGFRPEDSTVFAVAAEAPHSVTDHQCNDPEGILDTMCSAMSTIASNNAVLVRALRGGAGAGARADHRRATAGRGATSATTSGCTAATASRRSAAATATAPSTTATCRAGTSGRRTAASRWCRGRTTSTSSSWAARPGASPPSSPAGGT